nr:hypothetical protein B0A51_17552 [Rachicladosporium sp. CCFEE 5018]
MTRTSSGEHEKRKPGSSCQVDAGLYFHLNGLFVRPAARGHGLGRTLVEAAIAQTLSNSQEVGASEVIVTILVDEWNTTARLLYESCGFVVIAKETYRQQAQEQAKARVALRMELRCTPE